jgi:Rrf2 family protein
MIPMKLNHAASYAVHAMVHIAGNKPDVPQASHEIAQKHKIPERFLLKVLKPMVSAGLLRSVKGPHGGYSLAKPAAQISLLQIVEAVDGPVRGQLAFHAEVSDAKVQRRVQDVCTQVADQTKKTLSAVKLSQLMK